MSAYHARFYHLRSARPFTEELVTDVRRGVASWRDWVNEVLAGWEDHERRKLLPKPTYAIEEPTLSPDRKTITIKIMGDPITHGAMMLFEDQIPPQIYAHIPSALRGEIEIAYENSDFRELGQTELRWHVLASLS